MIYRRGGTTSKLILRSESKPEKHITRKNNNEKETSHQYLLQKFYIYKNCTAAIILNDEKLDDFLKVQEKDEGIYSNTSMLFVQEFLLSVTGARKRDKRFQIRKEEVKLSLFTNDMILYTTEHPRESTKIIGANKQVQQDYRTYDQHTKLTVSIYCQRTNEMKKEIKKKLYFKNFKAMKYLGTHFTKKV